MGAAPGASPAQLARMFGLLALIGGGLIAAIVLIVMLLAAPASARDDGRYANSPLKPWFDQLSSGRGRCCSDADGAALADVDWDTAGGHYRVRIDGAWVDVPDDAVVTEPNRFGLAMVWPFWLEGRPQVRCFMPGAGG